jgi:hypothetical protein
MLKRHLAPQTLEKLLTKELIPDVVKKSRNPIKRMRELRKEKDDTDAQT